MKTKGLFLAFVFFIFLATAVTASNGVCSFLTFKDGFAVSDYIVPDGEGASCNITLSSLGEFKANEEMTVNGLFYNYSNDFNSVTPKGQPYEAQISCLINSTKYHSECSTQRNNGQLWLIFGFCIGLSLILWVFMLMFNDTLKGFLVFLWVVIFGLVLYAVRSLLATLSTSMYSGLISGLFKVVNRLTWIAAASIFVYGVYLVGKGVLKWRTKTKK